MQQRKPIPRILGAAALALLFGAGAVQAESDKARSADAGQGGAASATSGSSDARSGSGGASSGSSSTYGSSDARGTSSATSGSSDATSGASGAARSGQGDQAAQSQLSKDDQKIVRELAEANLAEIETAKIALQRSQNPEIKQFAQRMIDDHTKSQQQLKQLADSKGMQLPNEPARKHKRMADKLADMQGEKFDREYRKQIGEKAHEDTHKLLERAQKNAKDADLQALVAQTLPVVEQHLDLAENLEEKGGRASGASAEGQPSASGSGAGSGTGASGASAPTGSSGASMTPESSGSSGASGGADSASGTSAPSSNMRGPGKQQ